MREDLPIVAKNEELVALLENVGRGEVAVETAVEEVQVLLDPVRGRTTCQEKVTVLAVRCVEAIKPAMEGCFLPLDELRRSWQKPDGPHYPFARLQMAFVVCSCLQLTSVPGDLRSGAQAVQEAIDREWPEE